MSEKYLAYLGFSIRAGKCGIGTYAAETSITHKKARLVLIQETASERTYNHFRTLCEVAGVEIYKVTEDLAKATGRTGTKVFSVNDESLAKAIINNLGASAAGGARVNE